MAHRHPIIHRFGAASTLAAIAAAAVVAFAGGSASARATTTLRLFAKSQVFKMYKANGQQISTSATPRPGDYFIGVDVDYVGNDKNHAKSPVGSDNAVCTYTSATKAFCDEVIAMGGSLLLFDHVPFSLTTKITGGTGKFRGARGSLTVTVIANSSNSDFTVTYST